MHISLQAPTGHLEEQGRAETCLERRSGHCWLLPVVSSGRVLPLSSVSFLSWFCPFLLHARLFYDHLDWMPVCARSSSLLQLLHKDLFCHLLHSWRTRTVSCNVRLLMARFFRWVFILPREAGLLAPLVLFLVASVHNVERVSRDRRGAEILSFPHLAFVSNAPWASNMDRYGLILTDTDWYCPRLLDRSVIWLPGWEGRVCVSGSPLAPVTKSVP